MKDNKDRTFTFSDPKARLKSALDTIENYTQKKSSKEFPSIHHLNEESHGLGAVMQFARRFALTTSSESTEQGDDSEDLLQAFDDITRFQPVVEKKQSDDARSLAQRAHETLSNYRRCMDEERQEPGGWSKRLLRFLIKKSRHEVPTAQRIHLPCLTEEAPAIGLTKTASLVNKQAIASTLSPRERDAFRMKAISLIKEHKTLFPSISETLSTLRNTPIYTVTSPEKDTSQIAHSEVITLEQRLTPFPGETLILRGSFKRDPGSLTPSTPITDSFEIASESIQTGFPYPSLHHGWALSNTLLPPFLYRPDRSPQLDHFLQKRESIARALLEKGPLLERSRLLWKLKIEASLAHREGYLRLQKSLSEAVLAAAPKKWVPNGTTESIEAFFFWVGGQESPYEVLASTYKEINDQWIDAPYRRLQEEWLSQSTTELFSENPKERVAAVRDILMQGDLENDAPEYTRCFGSVLLKGGINVILQYFSETLESPPPQLTLFERKLQSAALYQLEAFYDELAGLHQDFSFERISERIASEIERFRTGKGLHPLCRELENYYVQRFAGS